MKTKLHVMLTMFFLTFSCLTFAQEKQVSGTVTDDAGMPLPGVNIIVKGTSKGTQSDFDGNYSIMASTGDVLSYSFIGFEKKEFTVGTSNTIDVQMSQGEQLGEVVLTALGLEKKKDEDLSSSTTVDVDALKNSGETGVIQGLTGKTSGLLITKSTGDPGAGAYIQIRGQNTILGSGSPLIILDGVQISNTSVGSGTAGVVQQSRLNDINPEDIANVTVLKGAAAAAVYGTGAANGVLIIKTKTGAKGGKKMSVSVKSSVSIDEILVEHKKQDKFGQGYPSYWIDGEFNNNNGIFVPNTGFSYGDRIADRSGGANVTDPSRGYFEAENGTIYEYITPRGKNDRTVFNSTNRDQVFQNGLTLDNNVSIGFNGDSSSSLISLSHIDQEGIIRGGSSYDRTNFRLNHTAELTDALTLRVNTQYAHINSNRIQQGSNLAGLYLGYLRTSPDFDNRDYKGTYFNANGVARLNSHRGYRNQIGSAAPTYNNPGWTIYEQDNPNTVDRFIINPEVNWKINDNNNFTFRYGLDYYNDIRESFFPFNSAGVPSGSFSRDEIKEKSETINAFLTSNYDISEDFNLSTILGFSAESNDYHRLSGSSANFTNPFVNELRIFGNAEGANEAPTSFAQETKKSGVYAVLNGEIWNQVFVELSGRYERPSTLNDNIFYPSAALGWAFSEAVGTNDVFSFGKFRASYGEVGIEPSPYLSRTTFGPGGTVSGWGDLLAASLYGNPFTRNTILGNPNLKEERVKEFEIGTDLRFFRSRLTFGATYYDRVTEDAILDIDLAPSSGFYSSYQNAAEISNKGLELDLSYKIIQSQDFNWSVSANWSKNDNIVESLSGVAEYSLAGFTGSTSSVVEGEPFGVIYGNDFLREADGSLQLDDNGFPIADPESTVLGDPNPDWKGGMGTNLNYKGLTFSVFFDTSQGNDMWTGTEGVLKFFGIHPETANESTAPQDLTNYYGEVYPSGTTFRGNIADFGGGPVALDVDWYTDLGGGFGNNTSQFVQDASWTRLRELSLGYELPTSVVSKLGLTSMNFNVTGRNLVLWTDVEGLDPETNLTGASKGRGLDYFTNPSTKSYLFTLRLTL
jgi:TonB-linked SusC/RagA family outer membrane protein